MNRDIEFRLATASDLAIAQLWLSGAGLPSADLTPDHMQSFLVAVADGTAVGMIGLERFGSIGLLRSLVVDPSARGEGIGGRLVDVLESKATELGIEELCLLTIDADSYFSRLGYVVMDRGDVPEVIEGTAEFSRLCPGDAVLMVKIL